MHHSTPMQQCTDHNIAFPHDHWNIGRTGLEVGCTLRGWWRFCAVYTVHWCVLCAVCIGLCSVQCALLCQCAVCITLCSVLCALLCALCSVHWFVHQRFLHWTALLHSPLLEASKVFGLWTDQLPLIAHSLTLIAVLHLKTFYQLPIWCIWDDALLSRLQSKQASS